MAQVNRKILTRKREMILEAKIRQCANDFEQFLVPLFSGKFDAPRVAEAMRYSTLDSGKRFRPFLLQQVGTMFDVSKELCLQAAVSVELIHCYSLIHDDLPAMDDDDMRRGRPSNHKQFDEATAILAGDALQSLAFEQLTQLPIMPAKIVALIQILSAAAGAQGMVGGQMLDMMPQQQDITHIQCIQQMKTGALIEASCLMGAILGNADQHQQNAIQAWARCLGEAFQITDDLLDSLGNAEKMGKAVQKDDAKGKVTFVSLLGIDGAKQRLLDLQQQAQDDLAIFEGKANGLHQLWQWLMNRDY